MEENIIQLNFGGRYQIVGGELFSLNYAERGMSGSSMGKRLPPELAKKVMEDYEEQQANQRARAEKPRPKKEIQVKTRAKTKAKNDEPKKYKRKKVRTIGTGVRLGGFTK